MERLFKSSGFCHPEPQHDHRQSGHNQRIPCSVFHRQGPGLSSPMHKCIHSLHLCEGKSSGWNPWPIYPCHRGCAVLCGAVYQLRIVRIRKRELPSIQPQSRIRGVPLKEERLLGNRNGLPSSNPLFFCCQNTGTHPQHPEYPENPLWVPGQYTVLKALSPPSYTARKKYHTGYVPSDES